MKTLLLVLVFIAAAGFAQQPSLQWKKSYAGTLSANDVMSCSARDNAGNNYIAGYNQSYTFIAKYDNAGSLIQTIRYVNAQNNIVIPRRVFVDNNGTILLVGQSPVVVKFDANGSVLWEHENTAYTVVSVEEAIVDNSALPSFVFYTGNFDTFMGVVKINTLNGQVVWSQYLNPAGNNYSRSFDIAYNGGNVYATGLTNSGSGDAAYTVKLTSAGGLSYQFVGAYSLNENSKRIEVNASGEAFVFGKTTSAGNTEVYLRRLSNSGAVVWTSISSNVAPADLSNVTEIDLAADPSYTKFFLLYSAVPPANTFITQPCEYRMIVNSSGVQTNNGSVTNMYPAPVKVRSDNSGNFYVLGRDNNKSYLRKYSTFGSEVYTTNVTLYSGMGSVAVANDFVLDITGNAYVGTTENLAGANTQVGIFKLNQAGSEIWQNIYDGELNASDEAIKVNTSSHLTGLLSAGTIETNFTKKDVIVKRHDLEGNEIWSSLIDVNLQNDVAKQAAVDNNDNTVVYFTNNSTNHHVAVIDSLGTQVATWQLPYGVGGFYLDRISSGIYVGNNARSNSSTYEIVSYNQSGVALFSSAVNVLANNTAMCDDIVCDAAGNVYACGSMQNTSTSARTVVVQKYNPAGTLLWSQTIPNLNVLNQPVSYIGLNSAGQVVCVSNTQSAGGMSNSAVTTIYDNTGTFQHQFVYGGGVVDDIKLSGAVLNNDYIYLYGGKRAGAGTLYDGFVAKLNTDASLAWEKVFATTVVNYKNDRIYDISLGNNEILAAGTQSLSSSLFRSFIAKTDTNGITMWEQFVPSVYAGDNKLYSIVGANQRVYAAGMLNDSRGFNGDYAVVKYCDNTIPQVISNNGAVVCANQTSVLASSVTAPSYVWYPAGQTTQSISVTQTGSYFVSTIETDGCVRVSDTLVMMVKPAPLVPSICAVTVDSLSTHNVVVWDKSNAVDVSAYRIYREDFTGVYNLVGVVPYDSLSEFHDFGANPNVTTKRYKISAVDSCGQESGQSHYHNTIYIIYVGNGQFTWNPLYTIENEPNPVIAYVLMRDDNSNGNWIQVASTAGTQNTLVDVDYALYPNASWRVETDWALSCTPTRGAINTSRSNIKSPSSIGLNNNKEEPMISIFPNPARETVQVIMDNSIEDNQIMNIWNNLGMLVMTKELNRGTNIIDISGLSAGIYTLSFLHGEKIIYKKLIIE